MNSTKWTFLIMAVFVATVGCPSAKKSDDDNSATGEDKAKAKKKTKNADDEATDEDEDKDKDKKKPKKKATDDEDPSAAKDDPKPISPPKDDPTVSPPAPPPGPPPPVPAPTAAATTGCAAPKTAVWIGDPAHPKCVKTCLHDSDCGAGHACSGKASTGTAAAPKAVGFCAEAAAPSTSVTGAACPAGEIRWQDGKCYHQCITNKDCGTKICTPFGGGKSGCI